MVRHSTMLPGSHIPWETIETERHIYLVIRYPGVTMFKQAPKEK